jgi:hypothetical protein
MTERRYLSEEQDNESGLCRTRAHGRRRDGQSVEAGRHVTVHNRTLVKAKALTQPIKAAFCNCGSGL